MFWQENFLVRTQGRTSLDISSSVEELVSKSNINMGICHVFLQHTSASLMLCENADPAVREDLETFMSRLVPDGDPMFVHRDEGDDDMPAHVRTVITQSGLSVPIANNKLLLGTWQGIYLWEHRFEPHNRRVVITINGEL